MRGLVLAALAGLASAEQSLLVAEGSFLADRTGELVEQKRFGHVLRVCNAFPHALPLQVFYDNERLTKRSLVYKECGTWRNVGLSSGQELDFKVGDESAGTLVISDLPWINSVVAVVVYDLKNLAGSFESQVFQDMDVPQVAIFDAYRGPAEASLHIRDPPDSEVQRQEELRYDSAVILRPGRYDVVLEDAGGDEQVRTAFGVADDESYVVVRCGGERAAGNFEQDVFVYPVSDPQKVEASRSSSSGGWGTSSSSSESSSEDSGSSWSGSSGGGEESESGSDGGGSTFSFLEVSPAGGLAGLAAITLVFAVVAMSCLSGQ